MTDLNNAPRYGHDHTRLITTGPAPVLLCLPHAGGGANVFRSWIGNSGTALEVIPLRLPGREDLFNAPALTTVTEMVEWLLLRHANILNRQLIILGHSMGALLAYALTQRLLALQPTELLNIPQLLVVAGYRPPHLPRSAPELHRLPSAQFWQALNDYGGIADAIHAAPELQHVVEPTLRADFQAIETYHHAPNAAPLPCPILALAGRRDAFAPATTMQHWQALTRSAFTLIELEGDHFFLPAWRDTVLATIHTMTAPC